MVTEAPVTQSDGNTAFLRAARAGNLDKVLEHLKSDVDINTANANGLNALHLASKEGHTHVVTELLSRGATVDASTKKGNTALHIASLAGQEEVVRLLVQHGAAVNVQSQNGFTPLYMAAQENHDNVVKFLLANGANQSLATEDGFTPLAVAMQQGHDKVVAVLLENDTRGKVRLPALHIAAKKDDCKAAALLLQNEHNPDVTSKSGFTPLHIAAHYGNEAIANLLLSKGADVNYSAKHNISPLHVAAKWGKSNLVALLLERGAHIEAKTRDGLTPLHCAARSGHEQVVDMMLERGAPISCKTKNGLAPLHMAAQGDHVDAARILLYHRAPVDEITVDYLTALHVAAHCGHVRVAKLLLDRKADPNARALNGFTPLHIACKKNRIKVVELLLKHGASIEATTESGLTPLHVASFMGCMNIVIYLLQNEANPDVPTVRGETPLHLAARANQTDIIRILLRNGAQVDARAREQQTPLHIASRLGNVDIVMLLLQHGAAVDSTTKDLYTALHIAAKEGQDEVAGVLMENGASLTATTNKGCTPLHLAAKYGNIKVAKLLLQKDAPVDSQGKNGVTPLHVASHYDHQLVAMLLLDKGASPHATAKNGHTPLHIAARKNQMDIATTLLEYGAKANAESRAGFTPLHLSAQEGHTDMSTLLIEHQGDTNHQAKNGLTPLHLCAQEDRVNVAQILVKSGANVDSTTKAGYTPLHVASHFGQVNMVRFLLQHGADTSAVTSVGYTPLHQAAQQGHSGVVSTLLNSGAQPNVTTKQGQTALSIAQKLGYISVVETLKVVTEVTTITTTTTTTIEEKYRVVAPETMQEVFMSDSEEEGGEDTLLNEQPYHYLTVDEMKSLGDDSLPIDVTQDDRHDSNRDLVSPQHVKEVYTAQLNYASDNVDISRHPVNVGKLKWKNFLVSFLVDARGGAMRGCRHSGVRVIVPPRKAPQPLRVTCRYLKRDKLSHPPPLMEGEALASRILELGPVGAKFLGPVIIEVPHFGSLRGREREIVILRSDNGETWREHTVEASEDAVHDVLNESFEKDGERNDLSQLEVCDSGRLTRILTTDFPQYFAVVSRVRQEVHAIGPEGGMVSSSVVPQVQAVFPQGALTKKIKVGLQAQPIAADLVAKLLGNRVAVSPIVTVEPRRRKFHKPITLTIPVPQAANKGMINQYSGDAPTLRLLCSITGGTTRAQWEDVTGSTPLTFVNDCVSFTTTVSARFWLMDCRNISEATKMATELYKEAIHVPFLAKFVVFAKRVDFLEARLRVFCMTDDKEDKTLEHQEHFTEVAKSRDVEVLEGKGQFVEFAGNLVPVTKSGDQLQLGFRGFRENRLAFTTRVKDPHADPVGRILFMKEAKVQKGDPPQQPVCVLNIVLPDDIIPESSTAESTPQKQSYSFTTYTNGSAAPARPELRLSDISNTLGSDWESLAVELGLTRSQVERIKSDHPAAAAPQHAMAMLKLWLQKLGNKASGVELQQALQRLGRDDIIHRCMISCDDQEMNLTSSHLGLDQSGFDNLREELGVSRDVSRETSLRRNLSLEAGGPYDEQDIMKDSESVEELVEKQVPSIERIEEIKHIEKRHGEQDDNEERKYIAEEKEVAEKRKSVRERTEEIEKRLSQTSMDEQQQRRDSQLFQGVSEGLERLNITEPTGVQELLTPGLVQTPPPSPAEFHNNADESNWQETKVSSTTTTITSEQHPGPQGGVDISQAQPPTLEGSPDKVGAPHAESKNSSQDIPSIPTFTGEGKSQPSSDGFKRISVVEETIVKAAVGTPSSKDSSGKFDKEVDKKKEKKEKEKEEKERKKKEKKERELKEKEEKERKEREKKERKEQEKREKEERQRREKEEKKNKTLKEKADKEKMEKEKKSVAKNDVSEKESCVENKNVVEDVFVKAIKDTHQVTQTSFVVLPEVKPDSVQILTESHGSRRTEPTPLEHPSDAKYTKDDISTNENDVEKLQKERDLHASFVRTTSLIDTKALIDNERAHSVAQLGPARDGSECISKVADKSQSSPTWNQIKEPATQELQPDKTKIPSASMGGTAETVSMRPTSFDKEILLENAAEPDQQRAENAPSDSIVSTFIQQEREITASCDETELNTAQPIKSTTAQSLPSADTISEKIKESVQIKALNADLNISGISRDIEEIINTAAAAIQVPGESGPMENPASFQGSITEGIQLQNTSPGALEKPTAGSRASFQDNEKNKQIFENNTTGTEKRVSFEVPQDANVSSGFNVTNDPTAGMVAQGLVKLSERAAVDSLLPEENITSQVTTTFKTEKVPVEPGKPPHVVNTVTEKVVSPTGVPEQVVTTVTDKKFSDSGRPDQVTTTRTEKKFSETGRPDLVTTTVTEKVFTEMGAPSQIIKTTVTKKMSSVDGKPTEIVKTIETDSPSKEMVNLLAGSTDVLQKSQPLLADLSYDPKNTVHSVFKGADSLPSESFTTIVTEKTVSGLDGQMATVRTQKIFTTEESLDVPLLDEEFLRETPKVTVVTMETKTITSPSVPDNTSQDSATAKEICYVTTPTMQRRAHSQRRTGEERPLPIDVSYLQDDNSDDETYIVTEPQEDERHVEDRFRINSSPEILNLPHSAHETRRLSPDSTRVRFQLGSLDSQESVSSDPTTPITPSTKVHKFTVQRVEEESVAKALPESSSTVAESNKIQSPDAGGSDKKLRRVERHFERMASQSLAEGTTPVRDVDFQRVVSQLSQEEVALSEDEYECLLAQVTTPSDEWDSQGGTDDSPEALEAAMLQTATVHERSPIPTFIFSQSSEDRDVYIDFDEEPIPPPVPSTVFWSFDDRPLRASCVSLDELGLPLTEPTAAGEALSHWENTDHLDLSVEEPALPPALPRAPNRSASVVEELLLGQETIPAPLARSVLRSTCFPDIPEVPSAEQRQEPETSSVSRRRSSHLSLRKSVPLSRSPLGLLLQDGLERTARQFADGLGVGHDGSVAQPLSSHPLPAPSHLDKDDSDPDSEPAIQENIKSYSERRAFWEQKASSGSGETPLTTPITTPGLTFEKSLQAAATVQTAPVPVPRHVRTESVDSEAEYLAQHGRNSGVENVAFNEEELCAPKRPARMHSVDEYSETPPPVAVRKAIYERSISLPCTDVPDNAKRKRQFEDHLKKEMVAENLMQQLEEEAVPEHKDLPHRSVSEDPEDSLLSDEAFDTEVCSDMSSVKDLTLSNEKKQSFEGYMRETAEALIDETMHNAEAIVHRAEEHVIQDPDEEVLEWHGVQDLKNRFEGVATQDTERRGRGNNLDEKTNTELRRESLARTHEITSSKLAEVMQYKGENISKPSDSLEVHVDKSETEDTEKSRDLDDDIRELEKQRRADSRVSSAGSKGTRGPGDHQSQSSSEDTQCESDVTPEDQNDGHSLYQPHQHIQDIVWEVGVQEQPEPLAEEFVQDIVLPSGQIILQNGIYEHSSKEILHNGPPASALITEEEARKVAEELVQNIEEEVSKRNIESPMIESIRQIAEEKNLEKREIELMELLLAKKQRDQGHLFTRTDTTTSSMEITDEDLRSSGVEIDLSPTESQSGLYQCMDPRARQEDEKPEALRSEDIDLSDLKPDPIQIEDVPTNDKMHKNFSIIEESDECDTRSDQSDVKTDPLKRQKLNTESIDELQQSLDAVNEELDEEFVVKSVETTGNGINTVHVAEIIEEEPTIECTLESFCTECIPQGSPTGSTTSSGGKRTPPPKPERKFSAHREGREGNTPEIFLKLDRPIDRVSDHFSIRAESIESQRSSSQDDRSPLSSGDAGKEISDGSGVVHRHASRPEGESSSSGERSGGLHPDRRSGADFDPYSSSSESHYQSFEQSYSRPCSSDVEGLLNLTTGSSEYESAIASTRSVTSTEYQTAVSSLSSRESMKSLDSESSGHLASIEVSSEASETLVPSGTDLDDMDDSSINIALDEDLDRRMQEPCDLSRVSTLRDGGRSGKNLCAEISDDDVEDTRDQIETDEEDEIPHIMKRSHEMTFNADAKAALTGRSESSIDAPEDKLASSMDGDTGSVLSMSISSASETVAVKTIIELSRTDSDKMDASGTSELLTASATSQEMSYSSESKEELDDTLAAPITPRTIDSGTSTPTHQRDATVSSVTLITTSVAENGIQSASTQVTSDTTSSASEPPRRSHRRNESTSNFSSFIPPKLTSDFDVNTIISESAEADDTDKKSVDEQLEESYQTEADQAFHREVREGRYLSDDVEPELEQLDGSRPHSQVSKSDSESGHRAVSSGFSDERADSELAEVLRQGSSDTACEDPIDRPLTPEPAEEVPIKPDVAEFSSEALASLSGLDLEYSQAHAFSRTVEYASHVSPLKEKPCVAWEHGGEHEEEMAEAEAAFHMVPHHSPHHGPHHHHPMPETIIEDDDAENSELAAREAALQEQIRRREEHMRSISPANIPDITVTEHMAAILDKDYLYPDLEKDDDEVVEESSQQQAVPDKVTTEMESVAESPTTESFEMLEKPDAVEERSEDADDFVIVEEIGREAQECDSEGQGVRISSSRIPIRKREPMPEEEEEFIAQSPPPLTRRIMDVKYYGEGGVLADEDDPFRFDTGHGPLEESYEENPPEEEFETEADVEAGKKWIEMQFGGEEPAAVTTGYNYEMDFERGPLEDIKEEDEMGTSSKIGSLGSQKESVGSVGSGSVKESLSSTPEYDVLAGKKYFTRSGEHDDISMSSLQEFESLETQVALDAAHRRIVGSQDSLNGAAKKRVPGDDISLASLADFEKMERACVEAERIEVRARVEEALLSEIDEGHESQVSDSDETISGAAMKTIGDSDSDDYDKRMFEIDEIIRQAQSNVERFDKPVRTSGGPESFGRGDSLEEVARVPDLEYDAPISLVTSTDSLELRSKCPDSMVTSADSLEVKVSRSPQMMTSADSIELQQQLKTPLKADIMTDSIEFPTEPSNLITSSDSLELETTLERGAEGEDEDASMAGRGSIRSGTGSLHDRSSSSGRDGDLSSLSAQGACARIDPAMLGSTDSLEPTSSTATHATYQYETDSNMSSSFTSGGSNTMVSSTETLEASASMGAEGVWYDETFVEGGPYISETVEASDDPGYSHVIRRVVQGAPEIRKVTFRGPSADAALKNLVEQFGPGDQSIETQHVDPDGNVHISRVVQRRVVVQGEVPRTDLTGPELEDYLQRHGMTETDLTTLLASTSSSQPGAVVATTQQRLTTSHLTGEGAAAPTPVRRPPPPHDISVDDEPEYDVREHDWRFNLQHSAEAPEDEEEKQ